MNERMYIHSFNTYPVECFPYQELLQVVEILKLPRQSKFLFLWSQISLRGRDQQINSKVYINKNVNIFSSGDKLNEEKEQG